MTGTPSAITTQSGRTVGQPRTVGRRPAAPCRAEALPGAAPNAGQLARTRRLVAQAVTPHGDRA